MQDEFYHRYLIRWNLLEPIVDAFIANGPRYNLLNRCLRGGNQHCPLNLAQTASLLSTEPSYI